MYDQNLLDSLDTNRNKNVKQNQAYGNNLSQTGSNFNNSTINLQAQPFLIQQQQNQQQHITTPAQFQPIIPIQAHVPPPGIFTILPSPSSNSLPIVQTSLQFQAHPQAPPTQAVAPAPHFIQIPIQQQPQQQHQPQQQFIPPQANMFYPEPMQPMFYNTAYPINFAGAPATNFYPPPPQQQQDFSQNDFIYEESEDFYDQQYSNNQINNYKNTKNVKLAKNKMYDAQPLQQPQQQQQQPSQRSNNNQNNNNQLYYPYSQQSNESYDTPVPFNEQDEAEFSNDFGLLKVNNENKQTNYHANRMNEMNEEDMRRQQVWNKLQKERETKNKQGNSGVKSKPTGGNGLPPVGNNKNLSVKKTPTNIVEKKDNFLEKNIEAIRNKENLVHRYPNKKYEAIHGKNAETRIKNIQG